MATPEERISKLEQELTNIRVFMMRAKPAVDKFHAAEAAREAAKQAAANKKAAKEAAKAAREAAKNEKPAEAPKDF